MGHRLPPQRPTSTFTFSLGPNVERVQVKNCLARLLQYAYRFHSDDFKSMSFELPIFAPPDFCESLTFFVTAQGPRLQDTDLLKLAQVAHYHEHQLSSGQSASDD